MKGMLDTVKCFKIVVGIIKGMLEAVRCHMIVVEDNQGYA